MTKAELVRLVRQLDPRRAQLVAGIDSAFFLDLDLVTDAVPAKRANQRQRLASSTQIVFGLSITNGPAADGTTASVGNVFVGGRGVQVIDGHPLIPGRSVTYDVVDLSKIYVIFTDAADQVRLQYFS